MTGEEVEPLAPPRHRLAYHSSYFTDEATHIEHQRGGEETLVPNRELIGHLVEWIATENLTPPPLITRETVIEEFLGDKGEGWRHVSFQLDLILNAALALLATEDGSGVA